MEGISGGLEVKLDESQVPIQDQHTNILSDETQGVHQRAGISSSNIEVLTHHTGQEMVQFEMDPDQFKDTKQAWVVCFSAWLIQVIIVGVLHIFGVFFIALLEEFKCKKADAAWIGSIAYGITMAIGPISSILINRFGNRFTVILGSIICSISLLISSFMPSIGSLYGTFSILYGIGTSLAYTPTMCIAGDYFSKYETTATGIMVAGSSTGTLILTPIAQAFVSGMGWRNAFRFFSGLTLVCCWSGYMLKPLPGMKQKTAAERLKKSIAKPLMKEMHLWKNRVYIIWVIAIFFTMFGYYIPYVHLVSHAVDGLGIPAPTASILMMILGASTATGRVMFGKIVQYGIMDRLHMHQLSMVVTAGGTMLLPLIRSFGGLVAYVIVIGLVDGCYVVLLPVMTTTLVGVENKVLAWGCLVGICSVTFTLGPPVAGWMYDAYGSYDMAFHMAGIPIVTGAVILFFIPWAKKTAKSTNVMTLVKSYDVMSQEGSTDEEVFTSRGHSRQHSSGSSGSEGISFTVHPRSVSAESIVTIRNRHSPNSTSQVLIEMDKLPHQSSSRRSSGKSSPTPIPNALNSARGLQQHSETMVNAGNTQAGMSTSGTSGVRVYKPATSVRSMTFGSLPASTINPFDSPLSGQNNGMLSAQDFSSTLQSTTSSQASRDQEIQALMNIFTSDCSRLGISIGSIVYTDSASPSMHTSAITSRVTSPIDDFLGDPMDTQQNMFNAADPVVVRSPLAVSPELGTVLEESHQAQFPATEQPMQPLIAPLVPVVPGRSRTESMVSDVSQEQFHMSDLNLALEDDTQQDPNES